MKENMRLLWYFVASGAILLLLLFVQFNYPEFLKLETRWLAIAVIPIIVGIILTGKVKRLGGFGIELEAFPSQRKIGGDEDEKLELSEKFDENKLPADYYFINHTSFLRREKQEEFKQRTNVNRLHYDIRVVVDSYYNGALERISYVQYYLHKSYPKPIQKRYNMADKFSLKELANGEYVLIAKVYLNDISKPIILERYITLWESGPVLDK